MQDEVLALLIKINSSMNSKLIEKISMNQHKKYSAFEGLKHSDKQNYIVTMVYDLAI